jgi:S-adenosylmethionine/arginine decarboxylase-like enzyme
MAKTRKVNKTRPEKAWGYHLIIDAADCDADAIRSKETIAKFSKKLVSDIDMVAFGPPRIVHFGTGLQAGYTLVQLIETSNITAHFAEDTNDAYIDVFSCKTFNPKDALAVVKACFNPKSMKTRFIKRQA